MAHLGSFDVGERDGDLEKEIWQKGKIRIRGLRSSLISKTKMVLTSNCMHIKKIMVI